MNMPLTELKKISDLAYIALDSQAAETLSGDVEAILNFVGILKSIDTREVLPLLHPLDLIQPLRADVVTEKNEQKALAKIAPRFQEHFYLVPKVLEADK